MDQFDAFRAMGEFWARTGAGFLAPAAPGAATGAAPGAGTGFGLPGFGFPGLGAPGLPWPGFPQGYPAGDLSGLAEAQAALAEAWASATALSQTMTASLQGGAGAPDPTAGAVLARIFDPQAWLGGSGEFDAALTRMAEGPQLADLWQTERRLGSLFTAWTALRRAQAQHQAVMLDAWTRAAGTFARAANERSARGESFASARALMTGWIETANGVLLEVQRSDRFLASQRGVLAASTDLRLAQQDLAAFVAEFYGQPTRGELDDVHKSLTELRREVRALRRERRALKTGQTVANNAARRTGEGNHG